MQSLFELQITAHSSGYCLGGTNWLIDCESERVAFSNNTSNFLYTIIKQLFLLFLSLLDCCNFFFFYNYEYTSVAV